LVKALPFDWTQEKFSVRHDKIEAVAQAKGYRLALENNPDLPVHFDVNLNLKDTANAPAIMATLVHRYCDWTVVCQSI
jgi:hypothetical protein